MNLEVSPGVRLHVRERGEGPRTTLLIHGWAVSGVVWEPVFERWPAHAGRLIVPDLRGTGFSTKPRTGYTLAAYAADVVALIDRLELTDLTLVGHSMGGAIAQLVALERPKALRSLVLVCPVPASGVPLPDENVTAFRSLGGHRAGAEQVLGMVMVVQPAAERMERMVTDVSTVAIECFLEAFDAWRTASFADRIGAIETPTLVLAGGAEQVLPAAFLREAVVAKIPGARLEELPGVGHYPQAECPERLTEALVAAATA